MVVANTTVDIPALKARHPLGDTVEAAGVQLRGRGRVRQGVCPFHEEAEGSFTVYSDSQRFYCFGCGLGGDVLDFIQRIENLSLPEALGRLEGRPGLAPRTAARPARTRRRQPAQLPPRNPALLTATARHYAGQLRRSLEAQEYLASRGIGPAVAAHLGLGYSPGHGLRQALESRGFSEKQLQGLGPVHGNGTERFAGMVVVPEVSGGLARWLAGRAVDPGAKPRFQSPAWSQASARAWEGRTHTTMGSGGRGTLRLAHLAGWGLPAIAALGTQGLDRVTSALRGCPRVFLAFDNRRRGQGGDGEACGPAWTTGGRRHPAPERGRRGRACHPSPRTTSLPPPAWASGPVLPVATPCRS